MGLIVRILPLFLALLFLVKSYGQDRFFIKNDKKSHALSFQLINNLIIIPIAFNGTELNFLVDTGVNNTILLNLEVEDSLKLKNTEEVMLKGLGGDSHAKAIRSKNNRLTIGKIVNLQHMVYALYGDGFNLSSQLGIPVNGIIGSDLFRDFIVEINYNSKRIKFYDPDEYTYKNCKKCELIDLHFYNNKPYVYATVSEKMDTDIPVKLLLDSGGTDALWLMDESHTAIEVPEKHFYDYLGKGLSGNVYGERSKIKRLSLGNYTLENANVAYPDFEYVENAYKHEGRNGTLGSEILKRFCLVFDYPNKLLTIKKPSKYFKDPFLYNLSGIELMYDGNLLVPERKSEMLKNTGEHQQSTVQIVYSYIYAFKPAYKIAELRKDSPAHRAGLRIGDILLEINNRPSYNYKLQEIIHLFSGKPGKQFKLLVKRDDQELQYRFTLEKMF